MQTGVSLSDLAGTGKQFGSAIAGCERIATTSADVAVWMTALDVDAAHIMQCEALLSDDEKQRAGRYRYERDRRRFIVARGTLRRLLGEHLGLAPRALKFVYARHGKPFLAECPTTIYFNVAHSEERAMFAFSNSAQPGVDIEFVHREIECERLARRFFTQNECSALQKLPAARRPLGFLTCWTRKEAVVKATGDGLSLPLDQFEVTVDAGAEPRIVAAHAPRIADCTLYPADAGADYVAAVALYTGPEPKEFDSTLAEGLRKNYKMRSKFS